MFDFARECTVSEVILFWGIGRETLTSPYLRHAHLGEIIATHTSMPSSRLCLSDSCNKNKLSDYYDHEYSGFSLLPWIFSPSLLQVVSRSTMSVYATSPHVIPSCPKIWGSILDCSMPGHVSNLLRSLGACARWSIGQIHLAAPWQSWLVVKVGNGMPADMKIWLEFHENGWNPLQ